MNKEYQPNERQRKCRYAFCYMGKNHDQTYCRYDRDSREENESYMSNEQCEQCEHYKSKYIEYPITVDKIETKKFDMTGLHETGSLVRISPCGKEYEGKTYLGIYLGDLPHSPYISYTDETRVLNVSAMTNPAIYVFELKKIIFGFESWWQTIDSVDDLKDITDADIENQWYVKLAKAMWSKPQAEKE